MQEFFYFSTDNTPIIFGIVLVFNFLFFFILTILDKKIYLKFLSENLEQLNVPLIERPTHGCNSFFLLRIQFDMFVFFVFVNFCLLFWLLKFYGPFVLNPFGSVFVFNFSTFLSTGCINFFLLFFLFLYSEFRSTKKYKTCYFFEYEEFLIYYVIHFLSFFIFSCRDFISLFICVEVLTFSFFVLLSLGNTKKSYEILNKYSIQVRYAEASLIYLIPNLFASVFFLIGLFFIYFQIGSLDFYSVGLISKYIVQDNLVIDNLFLAFGFFCLLLSFLIKLSVAPFHNWIILVYEGARQHIVFFLSTVSKIFYFLIFIKFVFPFFYVFPFFSYFLLFCSFYSLFVGTWFGIFSKRLHILIGYSGVLNIGYCFFVLSLFDFTSTVFAFYMFFVYSLLSMMFFFCIISAQNYHPGARLHTVDQLLNISFNSDFLNFFMIVVLFSIIGIPPLPGFFPKLYIALKLLGDGSFFFFCYNLCFVIISSFIYLRLISNLNLASTLKWVQHLYTTFSWFGVLHQKSVFFLILLIFLFSSSFFCDYFIVLVQVLIGFFFLVFLFNVFYSDRAC